MRFRMGHNQRGIRHGQALSKSVSGRMKAGHVRRAPIPANAHDWGASLRYLQRLASAKWLVTLARRSE